MTHTIAEATFTMPVDELGPLLIDRWAAERWSRGAVDPIASGPCHIVDAVGTSWLGHVTALDPSGSISIQLTNPYEPAGPTVTYHCTTHDVAPRDAGPGGGPPPQRRTKLIVTADDDSDQRARHLWVTVVGRVRGMVAEIRGRRTPVQAVVVIHGIGEQLPGQTLERFVETLTATAGSPVWNQADRISDSYELRQLTLAPSDRRPRTTFYEFYWANEVTGTTIGDVLGWLWSVMGRPPGSIPAQLRAAWALLWGALIAIAITALTFWQGWSEIRLVSFVASIVLTISASFLIRYLGDAARYLSPRPRNVAIRESIRRRGVDLVRQLHESGRYHRIVLVGHSLGSVVAYDIVTHLWPELHREHLRPENVSFRAIGLAHTGDGDRTPQSLQAAVWREMRRNTQPWLVTDLVTLGSPLAHGHLLLAHSAEAFEAKRSRGELPAAPPVRNNEGDLFSHDRPYRSRLTRTDRTFKMLNESSPFAAVRWTNLYFPAWLGLFGDAVGGPVAPVFGEWVRDVPLEAGPARFRRWTLLGHTAYWRSSKRSEGSAAHIDALRRAIDLDERKRLGEEAQKHDPLLYCRTPRTSSS